MEAAMVDDNPFAIAVLMLAAFVLASVTPLIR
jgi:hypothetical protein